MPRPTTPETEAVNADSFLDIVASVVSIMIIMVLMTGLKIKYTPVDAPLTGVAAQINAELTKESAREESVRGEVFNVAAEAKTVEQEAAVRQQERDLLAVAVASLEERVQGTKQETGAPSPQDAELAGKLIEARNRLDQIEYQRKAVENAPAPAVQVECYPTPLSRTVDGREVHIQLRAGRLAVIPLDALVERFKSDAQRKVYKLGDVPEFTDTVGPEGGFRLRYTLEKHELSTEDAVRHGRGGSFAQLKRWTLIPVTDELGETIDEALAARSQFRDALADRRVQGATVTVWTYPDSFDAFRRVKKELYRLGFPVAARPLPEGTPISGSPEGSKSAAE